MGVGVYKTGQDDTATSVDDGTARRKVWLQLLPAGGREDLPVPNNQRSIGQDRKLLQFVVYTRPGGSCECEDLAAVGDGKRIVVNAVQ